MHLHATRDLSIRRVFVSIAIVFKQQAITVAYSWHGELNVHPNEAVDGRPI